MKQLITPTYVYTPGLSGAGTINLSGISSFSVKRLSAIINVTRGVVIYAAGISDKRYTAVSGTTLNLFYDTSSHNSADQLQVIYDDGGIAVSISGNATEAKQDDQINELQTLQTISTVAKGAGATNSTTQRMVLATDQLDLPIDTTKGSGAVDSKTQRMVLASDSPGVQNLSDIRTNTDTEKGAGAVTSKTQRMVIATDQTAVPVAPNITRGGGVVDSNTQRITLASDGPGVQDIADIKTAVQLLDDAIGTANSPAPTKAQAMGIENPDGDMIIAPATENGAVGIGNALKKFRDGFADLAQGAAPDSLIWDVAWVSQGSSSIGRAGDAQGSSYMKISMCPITAGSEVQMITRRSFKYPMRFINMLSLSQRIIGQEFEVSIIGVDGSGVVTNLAAISDKTISGTVAVTSNVATINFATAHGLKTSDRVILFGNTERRLNVGPAAVTVLTATQITVPCTIANGTYTAGGVVRWADPLAYAKNGAGFLHENATATNATFLTRRNGFNTRLLNSTIVTTANATTVAYADPFNATSMNMFIANQEEFTVIPRAPDATTAPVNVLKWHQGLPDEELEYKIRIRAKNLDNYTRPVAKITAIAKTGTTTATVTTDAPHGLATTDFVQIYGVRDIVNFPNLTVQTQVASIVSPTQFTIIIGSASTTSSAGGTVFLNQGSVLAPGISAINVQSISRTNNILALVGNTTWAGYLPGETIQLHGCDATSMGLYDGAYKVLRSSTTILELESVGSDFGTINCGGAVMRRTDFRIHTISEIEHTRHIVELSNSQGAGDISKSVPVIVANSPAVTVSSGTVTTVSAVTAITNALPAGANVIGQVGLSIPGTVADVASAAITTTTTTAAFTPTSGTAYQVNVPVTAVSGTNPTLDFSIEESTDNGTNWIKIYDFPRITATGIYNSPILRLRGNRVRYVQTITGTTPSFTRAVNRSQISHAASQIAQLVDRTIVPNTLSSTTPSLLVESCQDFNILVRCTAQTTAATLTLQFSHDNVNWHTTGNALTTAVGFAHTKVANEQWKFARLLVTAAGTGITLAEAMIVGVGV